MGDGYQKANADAPLSVRREREVEDGDALYDYRFRRLVPRGDWDALPAAVRRRFSKRLSGTASATYSGEIVWTRLSGAGWLLAQFCRLIGAPLPLGASGPAPAAVVVSEDMASGGQCWTRLYGRARGYPQLIHSAKQFAGPTGLEEHIGGGFGMALTVRAEGDALVFASDHYFWRIGRIRLRLPHWLAPGATQVVHRDLGGGRFAFDLRVDHPLFGMLVDQHALFRDG